MKPLAGKAICRKCHPRCKICTGYGFHEQVCQECAGYKRGEQCEDECSADHFANETNRMCLPCHSECRGCYGTGAHQCIQCRNYKIYEYGNPLNDNTTAFNCTLNCTKDYPHKIFPQDRIGPWCSKQADSQIYMAHTASSTGAFYITIISVGLVSLVGIFGMSWYIFRKNKENKAAVKMTKVLTGEDSVPLKPTNVGPNLTKLRIIKEAELRRAGVLGMGAFGRVYKGIWIPEKLNNKIPVAIKVLIDINGSESSKEFLEEAYIMASVEHPNLLKLLAVCMTGEMMLITQLMPLGCLLDYVRKNKSKISSKAFLDWSCQIAKGMAYLEENRLVHRDLAARNVLVHSPSHVKITDFGLAKLLDSDSDEYKATGGKMPIKWLALECIRHRIFTSKSDVWAFGVTIWELLTYGARPYPDIEARDLVESIERGMKLPQMNICTLDVYMVLLRCWHLDANSRPTFKQLHEKFAFFATDPGRYLVIDGDKFLRLPAYTSKDEKDLIRTLAPVQDGQEPSGTETEEYLQPNVRQNTLNSSSTEQSDDVLKSLRYCSDPIKMSGDDETDSHNREVGIGNLRLDLPLDEDDYLMPTCQNQNNGPVPGYMDLIAGPAASVDNPEYLMGGPSTTNCMMGGVNVNGGNIGGSNINSVGLNVNSNINNNTIVSNTPAPTQTIGIPVSPTETEQSSDQEYYNDLQRELQPLRRSETTV